MKITKLELKNYKAHKHYTATFDGNGLISGSKGTGKTSLKDAFTWLMTTKLVDEPRPVDENGVQIDDLVIEVSCEFDDGTTLRIEDKKTFKKDGSVSSRHKSDYFFNEVPVQEKEYLSLLEENIGTLEQRKILLDPAWFAYGDGLKIGGKTSKTATQRRREIVISVAGAENIEKDIADNENKAKAAKFAIGKLKKDLDDAHAGVESLHNAKVDVSHLDRKALEESIIQLETEKSNTIRGLDALEDGNELKNTLKRNLSDAQTALSEAAVIYSREYQRRLEQAQKPYNEYVSKRNELLQKIQQLEFSNRQITNTRNMLIREIDDLEETVEKLRSAYRTEQAKVYTPDSTTCPTCRQLLPVDRLKEAEARFNQQKSEALEKNKERGIQAAADLELKRKEFQNAPNVEDMSVLEQQLAELVEPIQERILTFEETDSYNLLNERIVQAQKALNESSDDSAKEIYERSIQATNEKIADIQQQLDGFKTNEHLDKEIDKKGKELQEISKKLDNQQEILDECNEFTRKTLNALEKTIEEKFDGVRFKMFDFTLDGTQKDECITYAKTPNGYVPWENLSGGQKRSATISLANAFSKAWGIQLPLWIDDSQIYSEDELQADMQLIRITEVPHQKLEVR